MPTIPRKLPNASLEDWNKNKPTKHVAREHMERVIRCAPAAWQSAVRERLDAEAPPILARNLSDREWLQQPPEWAQAWDLMQAVADYEDEFGQASLWNLDDYEICAMAKKLAGDADELDAFWALITAQDGQRIAHRLMRYVVERRRQRERWVGALTSATIPMRLINGALDPVSGAHMVARYRELIREADVVWLDDIGHYPQVEAPGRVCASLRHFWGRIGAISPAA